jgi:hypothetical protein
MKDQHHLLAEIGTDFSPLPIISDKKCKPILKSSFSSSLLSRQNRLECFSQLYVIFEEKATCFCKVHTRP